GESSRRWAVPAMPGIFERLGWVYYVTCKKNNVKLRERTHDLAQIKMCLGFAVVRNLLSSDSN
ncbi:MAG: hypothetical protein ABSA33_07080, partial [Candidatus Micrarchaeaceae archaeon]